MITRILIFVLLLSMAVAARQKKEAVTMATPTEQATPLSMVDAFAEAEEAYKAEQASKEAQKAENARLAALAQAEEKIVSTGNATRARAIIIDPKSAEGQTIDAFDRDIAELRARLYANAIYKKTIELDVYDQLKFMHWLLENRYQDTASVLRACDMLQLIHQIEVEKLTVIRSVSKGNDKSFIQSHIRTEQDKTGMFGELILILTSK